VIARNPAEASTLPYLVRLPVPGRPVVLKVRDTWPRTAKVYCHAADEWPPEAELEILVDSHERSPYRFSHQQCSVKRPALPAGDCGVALASDSLTGARPGLPVTCIRSAICQIATPGSLTRASDH